MLLAHLVTCTPGYYILLLFYYYYLFVISYMWIIKVGGTFLDINNMYTGKLILFAFRSRECYGQIWKRNNTPCSKQFGLPCLGYIHSHFALLRVRLHKSDALFITSKKKRSASVILRSPFVMNVPVCIGNDHIVFDLWRQR